MVAVLRLLLIASTAMKMHCLGHIAHGTSRLCHLVVPSLFDLYTITGATVFIEPKPHSFMCGREYHCVYRRSLVYVRMCVHVYQCTVNWSTLSDEFQKNKEFQQFHKGLKMAELLLSHKYYEKGRLAWCFSWTRR